MLSSSEHTFRGWTAAKGENFLSPGWRTRAGGPMSLYHKHEIANLVPVFESKGTFDYNGYRIKLATFGRREGFSSPTEFVGYS